MENYSSLFHQIQEFMPKFISGLISLIPFFIIWIISKSIFNKITAKLSHTTQTSAIIYLGKSVSIALWIIAILTVFGTWGIDISALLAGLGLTGFAVGYALKDVLVNTIAGIMIIFFKTIEIDSHVALLDVKGRVTDIDLRYTTIEDGDSKHLIPNSRLLSEKITIFKE